MGCISVSVERLGGISASVGRIGGIGVAVARRGGINVSVGLVCDVGVSRYLRVLPEDIQWITVDTSIDYNVLSNTDWNVT